MSDPVQLGWRVPEDIWDKFENHVRDKHSQSGPYVRFELECAMREFIDEDELLAEAEALLREHTDVRGLSSSTVAGIGTDRFSGADTRKINRRVSPDAKEQFQIFADKHNAASYGRALASALDAYTDGGRARRVLEHVKRTVAGGTSSGTTPDAVENPGSTTTASGTSSGTTANSVENVGSQNSDTVSTAVDGGTSSGTTPTEPYADPELVTEIAEQLPTNTIPKVVIDSEISRVVGECDGELLSAYREAILNHIGACKHPEKDGVYISEENREHGIFWSDLDKAERIILLRRFAASDTMAREKRNCKFGYRDVISLFEDHACAGPSHQYAYDLMEKAADEPGFKYGKYHGQMQLRIDLDEVDRSIIEFALEENPQVSKQDLAGNGIITGYTAGPTPQQEAAADD